MRFKTAHTCPLLALVIFVLLCVCRTPKLQQAVSGNEYLTQIILQFMVFLIPAIIYCRVKGPSYITKLNFRPVGPAALGILLLTILLMIAGSWLIRMAQLALLVGDRPISFVSAYPITLSSVSDAVYVSLTFALLPAICEEFVFRSVFVSEYTSDGYSCFTVGALTSLLFAMMHFDAVQFPIYLWCGVLLVMLTYVTQSVIPAILCHCLYNLYGIFGENQLLMLFKQPQNSIFLLFVIACIFFILLILTLSEAERIFTVYGTCDRPTPAYVGERTSRFPTSQSKTLHTVAAWTSPFLLLCIAIFLIVTFLGN